MKTCPKCNNQLDDSSVFCTVCGTPLDGEPAAQAAPNANEPQFNTPPVMPQIAPAVDPYDHTAEFDAQDISDNKIFAMLVYLLSAIGIIIALLANHDSKYLRFHIKQAARFLVIEMLLGIMTVVLFWTIIIPFAAGICTIILAVVEIICFVQVCQGKAKEAPSIRGFTFLK